jgi:hypothetical protein
LLWSSKNLNPGGGNYPESDVMCNNCNVLLRVRDGRTLHLGQRGMRDGTLRGWVPGWILQPTAPDKVHGAMQGPARSSAWKSAPHELLRVRKGHRARGQDVMCNNCNVLLRVRGQQVGGSASAAGCVRDSRTRPCWGRGANFPPEF